MKRTDFYWLRLVGTGFSFLLFGLVTFVLGLVVLPVIRLLSLEKSRAPAPGARRGGRRDAVLHPSHQRHGFHQL